MLLHPQQLQALAHRLLGQARPTGNLLRGGIQIFKIRHSQFIQGFKHLYVPQRLKSLTDCRHISPAHGLIILLIRKKDAVPNMCRGPLRLGANGPPLHAAALPAGRPCHPQKFIHRHPEIGRQPGQQGDVRITLTALPFGHGLFFCQVRTKNLFFLPT